MQAYSMDLRVRVMADVDAGLGTKTAAQKYRVSPDWVRKLKRFRRQTGSFAARKQRVSHATKLDHELPRLQQLVEQRPDATLCELRQALEFRSRWERSGGALRRLLITFKSDPCRRAATARRPGPTCGLGQRATGLPDPGHLVFIDESGRAPNLVRQYGRCLRGQRLVHSHLTALRRPQPWSSPREAGLTCASGGSTRP